MRCIIHDADLENETDQKAILALLNSYAKDLQGYNRGLPDSVLDSLIAEIRKTNISEIFLARVNDVYAGMAICFRGFSTFHAKPVLNIHDFSVLPEYRKQGIGTKLLAAIEEKSKKLNCCKITLEVQEKNATAVRVYEKSGFTKTGYDPDAGNALFYSKSLVSS